MSERTAAKESARTPPPAADGARPGGADENVRAQIELHRTLAPRYAERYSFPFSRHYQRDWHREMIEALPAGATRVIDLCCGSGFLLGELRETYPSACGLDLSIDMLGVARQYVPGAPLIAANAERMPLRPGSFQAATCKGSLHHTRDHVGFLRYCREILEDGGTFVISEPCNDNPVLRGARGLMYRVSRHFDVGDEGFRTAQLRGLFEEAGFEVVEAKRYGVLGYALSGFPDHVRWMKHVPGNLWLTKAFVRIDRVLCSLPLLRSFAFQIIMVGRRRDGSGDGAAPRGA